MDYSAIKALAKELEGMGVKDLIAMAPQNDPFYVGTATDQAQGAWFAEVWERAGYSSGVHLRRIHYWLVSQDPPMLTHKGEVYSNTEKCWQYLLQASKVARYLGLVRIADIADNKNPTPHEHAWYGGYPPSFSIAAPSLDYPIIDVEGFNVSKAQPYHLEVWCEKSTMDDVLLPLCERYRANLVTFEGEVSVTACYDFVQRVRAAGGKPARVWYISDFDPAGNNMPVAMSRKVEYMLQRFGLECDVRITPLVLTLDQVQLYRLPRSPIKETERRAGKFEEAFGAGATELDALEALHPGELARILTEAMNPYYSAAATKEVRQRASDLRQAVREQVDEIVARYSAEIEAIRGMVEELEAVEVDASEYAVETYPAEVDDAGAWLFDSRRDYLAQLEFYKAHKAGLNGHAD